MEENPTNSSGGGISKTPIVLALIVVLLILGGGGYYLAQKNTQQAVVTSVQPKPSPTETAVFSSIQDALSRSISLECDYTDEDGRKTKAYLKMGAIRADISGGKTVDENGSMIMKDNTLYFWSGKQGYKMAFDMSEVTKQEEEKSPISKPSTTNQSGESMMKDLEKFKEYCKQASVADTLFTPPSNVTFQDTSTMMPSGMKVSTSPAPSGMSKEDMEKLKKEMMQNSSNQSSEDQ